MTIAWTQELFDARVYQLVKAAWEEGASDIHLREEEPSVFRIDGELIPLKDFVLTAEEIKVFLFPMMSKEERQVFEESNELDFSFETPEICRLRVNMFIQKGRLSVALRLLPETIPSMEELYLPKACYHFCTLKKGLVLVTGPTGSGKSTTLAAMLNHINTNRACHILTVEDPIEYIYSSQKSMVSQRNVGHDSKSFTAALRHAFRQDPDVVLLGEMRDLETMKMAITLAETGHLTFSTLHTGEAAQTVSRIVDSFPPHQQEMIRMQLAGSLAGVVSQQLLPLKGQKGRVAAREVLAVNRGVANLIRENKLEQITTAIQTGSNDMMFTMNHSLGYLYQNGFIEYDVAWRAAFDRKDFQNKYGK